MKTCFSTEVVDLHFQAPNRNKRESKYYWDELYTLISAADFSYIEVPYEPKWDFGGRSGIPRTKRSITTKFQTTENYLNHLKEAGLKGISCLHLDPTLFCNGNLMMYIGAFKHFAEEMIGFAKEAGTDTVTLTVTPDYHSVKSLVGENDTFEEVEKELLNKTADAVESLAVLAHSAGINLCLKNEYWGLLRGEKIIDFIRNLKQDVSLDVDTANLQIAGVDAVEFIDKYSDFIGVVHFTDTSFIDKQNAYKQALPEYPAGTATKVFRDIGDGNVDFKSIFSLLEKKGYDGQIVYNCRYSYDVCRSLLRTRYFINNHLNKA